MAVIKVTPEMMNAMAKEIDSKIQEWNAAVQQIYTLSAEMDAMWDGLANDSFNVVLNEDRPKFENLSNMMTEYSSAIQQAAATYIAGEEEVKGIVTRRK